MDDNKVSALPTIVALRNFLEERIAQFSRPEFFSEDPIGIPKLFQRKEDIEIAGFLTALISWGTRKSILVSAHKLLDIMGYEPYRFILECRPDEREKAVGFVHRTLRGEDLLFLLEALAMIYTQYGSLEAVFHKHLSRKGHVLDAISGVREEILLVPHLPRSRKHLANPAAGSHAKRILMFLRWMVRQDPYGIDFGLWRSISPDQLFCPLDVHSGRAARALGLLSRPQNDRRAVEELTSRLRCLCPTDPVRYDIALFHLGRPENSVLLAHAPLFYAADV
ncbi:MAG: TIGR02757 family protein [Flavobacteriales bacterium]|nr:TIGR02757 family protein [Flavobacteriales bacterium]